MQIRRTFLLTWVWLVWIILSFADDELVGVLFQEEKTQEEEEEEEEVVEMNKLLTNIACKCSIQNEQNHIHSQYFQIHCR